MRPRRGCRGTTKQKTSPPRPRARLRYGDVAVFCSFLLAILHAALVFGLAGLPGIARHTRATLVATLFATVRLLRLCGGKSAVSPKNDHYHCDDPAHVIAFPVIPTHHLRPLSSKLAVQMLDIAPP